jgi:hypothetical protein
MSCGAHFNLLPMIDRGLMRWSDSWAELHWSCVIITEANSKSRLSDVVEGWSAR